MRARSKWRAEWICVRALQNPHNLAAQQVRCGLAVGELSAIVLAEEMSAGLVLIDEMKARREARERGLAVLGCVAVLESAFPSGLLPDLRDAYARLLESGA